MRRGEIHIVDLNPTIGSETNKKRPVLIISNDINNLYSDTITIIPITSNTNKIYPFEVLLKSNQKNGLTKDSKVQCHQIRTVSKTRISGNVLGTVLEYELNQIEEALKLHLELE